MPTFFKKCPNCGWRFEVKHEGETLERSETKVEEHPYADPLSTPSVPDSGSAQTEEDRIEHADKIDVEPGVGGVAIGKHKVKYEENTYKERYRCAHCGYTWTEERVKDEHFKSTR